MFITENHNGNVARHQLQKQIDLAMNWFDQWRIKISTNKTAAALVGRKHTKMITPVKIDGKNITRSTEAINKSQTLA